MKPLIVLCLAAGMPFTFATAQQPERVTLSAAGAAVYNLAGEVQVEPGTAKDVLVDVTRGGRDAAKLTLQHDALGTNDALRVIYPDDELVYPRLSRGSSSNFEVREDGTFGNRWNGGRRNRHGDRYDRYRRSDSYARDRHQVTIRGSGPGTEAFADMKILVPEGATLSVYLGVGKTTVSNVNGKLHLEGASAPVTAQGIKGDLSIDVGSGSVSVTNAAAEIKVETGSGEVRVTGIQGRDLSLDTGSGDITASDITADRARFETGSGSISASSIKSPRVSLETGSGQIEADLATDVTELTVNTGSGDVVLRVPENLGAVVDIDTGSGRIDADVPLEVQRWARDHVTGRMGDGNGRLDIETGSGDVRIQKLSAK